MREDRLVTVTGWREIDTTVEVDFQWNALGGVREIDVGRITSSVPREKSRLETVNAAYAKIDDNLKTQYVGHTDHPGHWCLDDVFTRVELDATLVKA